MSSLALLSPLLKLNPTGDMEGMEDTVVGMEGMDMEATEERERLNPTVDMEDTEVGMEDTEYSKGLTA